MDDRTGCTCTTYDSYDDDGWYSATQPACNAVFDEYYELMSGGRAQGPCSDCRRCAAAANGGAFVDFAGGDYRCRC